jgi:hypothetical protein
MNKNNIFSNKSKPVNLTEEFFPSLPNQKEENILSGDIKKNISYAEKLNCAIKEEISLDTDPGSVVIYRDENNKIHYKYGKSMLKEKPSLHEMEEFKNNIKEMFERWENYKNNFIELNGEDDYNKQYRCPNYDYSYLNVSEEEEEVYSDFEEEEEEDN